MQSFNIAGFVYTPFALFFRKSYLIPHLSVQSLAQIDPVTLKKAGIKAILLDKDNTLTIPYGKKIHPSVRKSFAQFKKVFGKNVAIISNSAGTADDPGFKEAQQIEKDLGVKVFKHRLKKPAYLRQIREFKCKREEIAIIGDRVFTDMVFGNRNGMFTILVKHFTEKGDVAMTKFFRSLERDILNSIKKRYTAPKHFATKKMS